MKTEKVYNFLIISVLLLGVMAFSFPKYNDNPPLNIETIDACRTDNHTFQAGELLTYKVYYNWGFVWISAGEVTFEVIDEGETYHLKVVGKTYHSYDWIFKVRDYYDTWIDKETLLPNTSVRDVNEGKYTLYDKNTFDQNQNTVHNIRGRTLETVKEDNHFNIESCMHDMLSIVYWARNLNFENYSNGQEFPVKIFADKETWGLKVKYKGKVSEKEIKDLGDFKTMQFTPELIEGTIFPKGAEMNVWVSDDANRLPLEIESPLSVGYAKAILKDYKNLKHPLSSKIDN